MTSENRISEMLVTPEARIKSENSVESFHIEGLQTFFNIIKKYPGVSDRYKKMTVGLRTIDKQIMEPKKTLMVSFAALETFSSLRIEDLQKENLIAPVVFLYRALAVEWDDQMDSGNIDPHIAFNQHGKLKISANDLWNMGMDLINKNPNIKEPNKNDLIKDLKEMKEKYIYYECALKDPKNFKDLDPYESFVLTVEMRKQSFGEIAKVMTRILKNGVRDEVLEEEMANATLAFGIIDGFKDLSQDKKQNTMTEARALVGYKKIVQATRLGANMATDLLKNKNGR